MNAVYDAGHATGYEFANTTTYDDGMILYGFNGTSRKENWKPLLIIRERVNRRQACKPADLPCRYGSLLLRRSAVDALQDILDANGELLPMATEDGIELYVFNTLHNIDALDRQRSVIEPYVVVPGEKIRKHVFIEDKIRGIDIFRMPIGPGMNYYSERFVQRVKKAKLKGTEFIKLWSSDENA